MINLNESITWSEAQRRIEGLGVDSDARVFSLNIESRVEGSVQRIYLAATFIIDPPRDHGSDIREFLGTLEWSATAPFGDITMPSCPSCSEAQSAGHAPGCRLEATMRALA